MWLTSKPLIALIFWLLRKARRWKFSEEEAKTLKQVLDDNRYVSSDETGSGWDVREFKVRRLQWKSRFLDESFQYLDRKGRRSNRGDRRCGICVPRNRSEDLLSSREEPADAPAWAIADFVEPSPEEAEWSSSALCYYPNMNSGPNSPRVPKKDQINELK